MVDDNEEDFEALKKVQTILVIGRTVYCFPCVAKDLKSREIASFYHACGSFLCVEHALVHKCLVSSAMEYSQSLMASLA